MVYRSLWGAAMGHRVMGNAGLGEARDCVLRSDGAYRPGSVYDWYDSGIGHDRLTVGPAWHLARDGVIMQIELISPTPPLERACGPDVGRCAVPFSRC